MGITRTDTLAPEDTFAGLGRADPAALPAREAAPSPPDLEELACQGFWSHLHEKPTEQSTENLSEKMYGNPMETS
ncbi:hypothetical protein A1F99_076870 [Pyrenophora tritici-repentis]|nr:hypothetical protein A1F99_076870 [Pyrenophora tritici-repentis]